MKKHTYYHTGVHSRADFSCRAAREQTAQTLLESAANERRQYESYWSRMKRYYDGTHDITFDAGLREDSDTLPWKPAQSAEGFIHVESQIEADVPGFEFSPRGAYPYDRAKARETLVEIICDSETLAAKNAVNERRLGIYGTALWKVGWDDNEKRVTVEAPRVTQFYPDPAASELDACEYLFCVCSMHASRAARLFAAELAAAGEDAYALPDSGRGIMSGDGEPYDADCVTVTEFWFRQPLSGHARDTLTGADIPFAAGDIAMCLLIGGKEVRYIPKYWQNTDAKCYPFVLYTKTPNIDALWGKSELEPIIPLIDAADRELLFAQLNAAFNSNDIILAEENAFAADSVPTNAPGAVWKLRPGMMGKVQRLGNLGAYASAQFGNYGMWQSMMEQATGNFEVSQGKEPTRVTTASGIALLNERAQTRKILKRSVKAEGFKRLYRLIDRTALEFFEDGRVIRQSEDGVFAFRLADYADTDGRSSYIPELDVKIHIGDGIIGSKAFTVSAMTSLMSAVITRDNYLFFKSYVDLIGLPMRKEIGEYLDKRFADTDEDLAVTFEKLIPRELLETGAAKDENEKEETIA